jgi:hypothetical protein
MRIANTPLAKAAPPRKRRGCWLWLGVALVLAVVGLFGLRGAARSRLQAELSKQVGPARAWDVRIGVGLLPRALLGLPLSASVRAKELQPKGAPQVKELAVEVRNARFDVKRGKLAGAERIGVDCLFDEKAVAAFVRQQTVSAKLFSDVTVSLTAGEVVLNGTVQAGAWASLWNLPAQFQAVARATTQVRKPATVALMVSTVKMRADGGGEVDLPTTLARELIALDLSLDFRRNVPGMTIDSCAVSADGLRLQGTIDPQALAGGKPSSAPAPREKEATTT